MKKYINYGILALVVITFFSLLYIYAEPDKITAAEIRIYIALFFVIVLLLTFGVLRVYNAIVVNSSLLRKLSINITTLANKLEDNIRQLNSSEKVYSSVSKIYEKAATVIADVINKLLK